MTQARVVIENSLMGRNFPLCLCQCVVLHHANGSGPQTCLMATGPLLEWYETYAPVPHLPTECGCHSWHHCQASHEGMIKRRSPLSGVLYAELILTADGPKVIGSTLVWRSETQIILPRLTSDFAQISRIFSMARSLISRGRARVWLWVWLSNVLATNVKHQTVLAYEKECQVAIKKPRNIITTMQRLSLRK